MSDEADPPRRRRRASSSAPKEPAGSVARGAVLVAIAVVVGIFLLRDEDQTVADAAVGAATDAEVDGAGDGDTDGDGDPSDTTPVTEPPRPPGQVKVVVGNGSIVDGAAGAQTDALEAQGYITGTPADVDPNVEQSAIYYVEGYEPEAVVLANFLGADPAIVQPVPPVPPIEDTQLAQLILVLGPDLAG